MPRRDFLESPVTQVIDEPDEPGTRLTLSPEVWLDEEEGQLYFYWALGWEVRRLQVAEMKVEEPGHWEILTQPNGVNILVRPVQETDAVASTQFGSAIPLPVDVIAASLKGFNVNNQLEALVGDDGFVRTILLVSDVGLYTRYSGMWHPVTDESQIDGLNAVDVADAALDVYDPFDQAGQLVNISSLPTVDPVDRGVTELETPSPPTVVAGLSTVEEVEILTARDVPRAVEVATRLPQYRWYVERRVDALNVNIVLPWATSERTALANMSEQAEELGLYEEELAPLEAVGQIVDDASMVALYPDRPDELKLDVPGAEDPEVIHLTLAVMHKPADMQLDKLHELNDALANASLDHGPFELTATGVDQFGKDPDNQAAVLLVDGDGLGELRDMVKQKVDELGLEREGAFQDWKPHVTLGYGVDPAAAQHLVGKTFTCSNLASVCGPDKYVRMIGEPESSG